MKYFVVPTNIVCYLEPKSKWYGKYKYFGFLNSGESDTYLAEFRDTSRSITSHSIYLKETTISLKSTVQKIVLISITEADTNFGVSCAQDILYATRFL